MKLRHWQQDCLKQQLATIAAGGRSFFVAAGVGSGKTTQALTLATEGSFDLVVAVTPKSGIRGSWEDDANKLGISTSVLERSSDIDALIANGLPKCIVLNVQMLAGLADKMDMICRNAKVLVAIDEAHHVRHGKTWGETAKAALGNAAFTVALSGTPYADDGKEILCLEYIKNNDDAVGTPQYVYPYERALAEGHVAKITTRFVSGTIEVIHDDGLPEVYDYDDGDYSGTMGKRDLSMMGRRLVLSAVESFEWQMGAFRAAREQLERLREDGNPWAGLVVCKEIDQARQLASLIEERFGDKVMLCVDDANTEKCVRQFNADHSYKWIVSITKISEGISVKRLRVCSLLTNTTTRTFFEQVRGRIARLLDGVKHSEQDAYFFVPADQRLIDYALESNKLVMHHIKWTDESLSEEEAVALRRADLEDGIEVSDVDIAEEITNLRSELNATIESMTVGIGSYTIRATVKLDGAAIGEELLPEREYARNKLAERKGAIFANMMSGAMLSLYAKEHGYAT